MQIVSNNEKKWVTVVLVFAYFPIHSNPKKNPNLPELFKSFQIKHDLVFAYISTYSKLKNPKQSWKNFELQ